MITCCTIDGSYLLWHIKHKLNLVFFVLKDKLNVVNRAIVPLNWCPFFKYSCSFPQR